ncbi:MAG: DUF3737 family protein [Clostridia bacterium]|nr:DUF3737 family protein [Clostridia bacterium]
MKEINQKILTGERAGFGSRETIYNDCIFRDGESHRKHSENIELNRCRDRWKEPLWYCKNVTVNDGKWFEEARAGVWYTDDMTVNKAVVQAPKNFRRCRRLELNDVVFTNAAETLWSCEGVRLNRVSAKGDYFCMNSKNLEIDGLTLDGKYSFDGVENVVVRNSNLVTKDAFWNSKNVTVYDSFVSSEYLGWNSENLTLINCTVESNQGLCYIDNLVMKNCRLIDTTFAFEYSNVNAEIVGKAESVFNPASGRIKADEIGELILESDRIDPSKTEIVCGNIDKESDLVEWRR